ncbi:sugar phosphate isomerase/epimerase family protein [Gallalistipes aquisgranensis]|uniref:sugar phosphate isomerase/epimerase family protein n=1 Tax=Gallalistipes aquisgranensis TaxID=2779358 RepID=UPI001CF8077E|nr:sugar phosphate isomerase/epimerase family protein [Gallalistipes aquisgranensis]
MNGSFDSQKFAAAQPAGERFNPHITCAFLYSITRYGYPPAAEGMVRYVNEMADLGFRSIELEGIGADHLARVYADRGAIRAAIEARGLSLPVFCTVLPGLGSADAAVRRRSLETFEMGCETAAALGAGAVLDNGPLVPYAFPPDMPIHRHYSQEVLRNVGLPASLVWGEYWKALAEVLRAACDIAAGYGLRYYLHPCTGSLTETTDGFLRLRDAVGRENLRFNFDTANQFFVRENLSLGLLKLGGELDYIHISDNHGQRVEHLAAGDGAIDWDMFFSALKRIGFSGQLSIDVGGDESGIENIDEAYLKTARWIERKNEEYGIF